ncbi:unnamed protein product, partial [Mesorhabditis belari]|uniref:guanylate cyclase n=1 Tax=Mesorhabditis belari TaxID=2138241 RepID=A0AAF3J9D4_9BILA
MGIQQMLLLSLFCFVSGNEEESARLDSFLESPIGLQVNRKTDSSTVTSIYTDKEGAGQALVDNKGRIRIRVGHIGALNALRNDEVILAASRKSLHSEGILDDDFDIELVSQNGCGESYEGVAVAADMYHLQKVKAFIGPYCSAEIDAVARMASFWNIPIIGYMAASATLTDKNQYRTMARISMRSTTSIAEATCALLRHYKWNRVALVSNVGAVAYERTTAFEEVFRLRGVQVIKKVMFDEYAKAKDMYSSGLMQDLKNSARIIIMVFSNTREQSKEFMTAATSMGMSMNEYAYILPWLQDGSKDSSPWTGADGEMLQNVKDQYANAIIIDDVNGFDNSIVQPFLEKIKDVGLKQQDVDLGNVYGYLYLFDALKLYAMTARAVMNETGNPDSLLDGRLMWNKMRRISFLGMVGTSGIASGKVTMDDRAERAPLYRGFFISPNQDQVMPMVHMEPLFLSNCDYLVNGTGCFEVVVTDMMRNFWPTADNLMPLDEPRCGYRGERCDYTLIIIGSAIVFLMIVSIVTAYLLHDFCERRSLNLLPFRIFRDDLQLIDEEQVKSMLSLGSTKTKLSNMQYSSQKNHAILGLNTHCVFHRYVQRRPILFSRVDKSLLLWMKQAVHDNINTFMGICFNEREEVLLVWKFCSRGSLQDIIYNESITLDAKFHGAFVRDIVGGLEYLHASPIGYHGSLTPWSCLIDRNWMVKLTDYGIAEPLERWEKAQSISKDDLKNDEDRSQATQKTSALYDAPEMLKMREKNKQRRMDQDWNRQTQARRQFGDIYAFGMIFYEIMFRALPFPENTDINALVDQIRAGERVVKPGIQNEKILHYDLANLITDCWNGTPEMRPSVRRIKLNVETYLKVKGSLVDQMMRMMEQYANNLEKLVQERTGMLEEANARADRLLSQLLPAYVANELKLGRSVPPKTFSGATVMFSDIVGFTDMCSNATPLEVVTVLNSVFNGFDEFIARHEAYKVETIGDAYMVVSGVPEENGFRHIREIATIALDIHKFLSEYCPPHHEDMRVRCRLGFATGPVAAAVVGLNAPRYCLFGDTVNMASRMESTGEPEKTQISEAAKQLLNNHYPEFECVERGQVHIKGKGMCTTYWLEGSRDTTHFLYRAPTERVSDKPASQFGAFLGISKQ